VKKILVVEGSRPIEGLSGSLFNRRECVLEVASSAAEALELCAIAVPDLVLLDAHVAEESEVDLEELIADLAGGRELPVVVILGELEEHREAGVMSAGAACAFARPVDDIELNARVCELLGISVRRHLRTFVKMKVDATVGNSTHFATISNISLGGVLIETERPIHLGDIIKLSFFLPQDDVPITVITQVVRAGPGQGHSYGCQFLDLAETGRDRISEFVSTVEVEA
jgi:DNA-binding response OmpR family regulator